MSVCKIQLNTATNSWDISDPKDIRGKRIWDEIQSWTQNKEEQTQLISAYYSEDFQKLNLKNPSLENLLNFIEQEVQSNIEDLTTQEAVFLYNFMSAKDTLSTANDFIELFKDSKSSRFNINTYKLLEAGFTVDEINSILSQDNADYLHTLYSKLSKQSVNAEEDNNISVPQEPFLNVQNSFGQSEYSQEQLYDYVLRNYVGAHTLLDVKKRALMLGDTFISESPENIQKVFKTVNKKASQISYSHDMITGYLQKQNTRGRDLASELLLGLSISREDALQIADDIGVYLNFRDHGGLKNGSSERFEVIESFVRSFKNLQIDLDVLERLYDNPNYQDRLLEEVWDVLNSQTDNMQRLNESLKNLSNTYDEVTGTKPNYEQIVDSYEGIEKNDMYIHTTESEEKLFRDYGVIKVSKNSYRKIDNTQSLSELYSILINNSEDLLPEYIFKNIEKSDDNLDVLVAELDKYITEKVSDKVTQSSNLSDLKFIESYKLINGIEEQDNQRFVPQETYLMDTDAFQVSFNGVIIQNPEVKELFRIGPTGIELKIESSEYALGKIKVLLDTELYNDLINYSRLRPNHSLREVANLPFETSGILNDLSENNRDYYANNLDRVEPFRGKYEVLSKDEILADSQAQFLKFDNKLYEKIKDNLYKEVQDVAVDKTNTGLEKPETTTERTTFNKVDKAQDFKIVPSKRNIEDNKIEFCK